MHLDVHIKHTGVYSHNILRVKLVNIAGVDAFVTLWRIYGIRHVPGITVQKQEERTNKKCHRHQDRCSNSSSDRHGDGQTPEENPPMDGPPWPKQCQP